MPREHLPLMQRRVCNEARNIVGTFVSGADGTGLLAWEHARSAGSGYGAGAAGEEREPAGAAVDCDDRNGACEGVGGDLGAGAGADSAGAGAGWGPGAGRATAGGARRRGDARDAEPSERGGDGGGEATDGRAERCRAGGEYAGALPDAAGAEEREPAGVRRGAEEGGGCATAGAGVGGAE